VGIAVGHLSLDKRDEGSSFSDVALLRASILETVSAIEAVEVVEIPEEPLTTLAPRPELAEQGVRFLIVGSARLRPSPQFSSVSLQVVDTESGAVKLVSTAHHRDISLAAVEAGRDIAERFREVL